MVDVLWVYCLLHAAISSWALNSSPGSLARAEPCFQVPAAYPSLVVDCTVKAVKHDHKLPMEQDQQSLCIVAFDQDRYGLKGNGRCHGALC